jgi:CBS domain-containing protein
VKVREVMTREVEMLAPGSTAQQAAQAMAELGTDVLPVGAAGKIEGILTDRDILIRVVAEGRDAAATPLGEIMSRDLTTCGPDDPVEEAAIAMERRRVRRLPVLDDDGGMIGMVTLERCLAPDAAGEQRQPGP